MRALGWLARLLLQPRYFMCQTLEAVLPSPSSAAELAAVAGFGMHPLLFLHFLQPCVPSADGSGSLAGRSLCVGSSLSPRIKNAVED